MGDTEGGNKWVTCFACGGNKHAAVVHVEDVFALGILGQLLLLAWADGQLHIFDSLLLRSL